VLNLKAGDLSNSEIDVTAQAAGIYFLRLFVEGKIVTSKVIIE
jgi:hypothetical protein